MKGRIVFALATLSILILAFLFGLNPRLHLLTASWVPGTPARAAQGFFKDVFVNEEFLKAFDYMDDPLAANRFIEDATNSFIDIPRITRTEAFPPRVNNHQIAVLVYHIVRSRLGSETNAEAVVLVERRGIRWKVVSVAPGSSNEFREFMEIERQFRLLEELE